MNEKPILFNSEMVRAILDGRKTQTRRVVKLPQNADLSWIASINQDGAGDWVAWGPKPVTDEFSRKMYPNGGGIKCPYGRPGDLLWVRETFCVVDDSRFNGLRWVDYKATPKYEESDPAGWDNAPDDPEALKWKPSIHMPRWASRITLRVTGVYVERLWQMSVSKMEAEGVMEVDDDNKHPLTPFITLWDSINARRGYPWESNPWVWVVEFEVNK